MYMPYVPKADAIKQKIKVDYSNNKRKTKKNKSKKN